GGGLFPLGSAPLPDSQSQQSARRGNERKIHMNRLVQLKQLTSVFLVALLLACFGFLCAAQAVVPAPDGGYPGGNTAEGQSALLSLTIGGFNTAVGYLSLRSNTNTSFNTAVGAGAGSGVITADNVIAIGAQGANVDSSCFIGNIRGVTTANTNAIPVVIDSAHQLGTMSSSRRFKNEIQPMDKASESILALRPVTFYYKSDKGGTPQFGLVAEQVAEVNPDLVVRDDEGEIYTVRYDAVNAMLL